MVRANPRVMLMFGAALGLAGCSREATDPNRPKTAFVNGSVNYQGKPLADAAVTFVPQTHEHAAIGRSDSEGHFELRSFEANDGAVPGEFKVTVVKFELQVKPPTEELSDAELERREGKTEPPPPKSLVPEKYGSPKTSGLSVKVVEGTNEVVLELKD